MLTCKFPLTVYYIRSGEFEESYLGVVTGSCYTEIYLYEPIAIEIAASCGLWNLSKGRDTQFM